MSLPVAARSELWRRGELRWKLHAGQLEVYQFVQERSWVTFNCARRWGKSHFLCVLACETALKNPGKRINFAAPTSKQVRDYLAPIMGEIILDAPPDCKPWFDQQRNTWTFPNGAMVFMFGCEDTKKADRGRGPAAILNIVDEAGFVPVLEYVITSILNPQVLTTGGSTIISSTPPVSMSHYFYELCTAARAADNYIHRTVYQNPMITAERLEQYISKEAKLKGYDVPEFLNSTTFLREYMAEFVTDESRAVIPEWRKHGDKCIGETPLPMFYDAYVSLDLGFSRDATGLLFAFYDWQNKRLVVQEELLLRGKTTRPIAEAIRAKEAQLWPARPYRRVADGGGLGNMIINELIYEHGLAFIPTHKDEKNLQIDKLRRMIVTGEILISPKCVNLLRQLRDTVWTNRHNDYERNSDGHGDLLDACIYMVRNIDWDKNPVPPGHGLDNYTMFVSQSKNIKQEYAALANTFGKKRG